LRGRFKLDVEEAERLLCALDPTLAKLGLVEPLLHRDLLQLRRGVAASEEHLARFCRFHVHDDDEGRYVVAGTCQFGFAIPGFEDLRLTLGPGDYLKIPAGTEHWFSLGQQGILQSVRLFSSTSPMSTTYTGRVHPPK
jgi:1,2-dihydroxy-3-keto-5-methylthiopentene dioxygenase